MSATKYLDLTGLQYFKSKLDERYVTSSDLSDAFATYKQGLVTIVSSLPSDGEEGKLYLVPDSNASSSDVYITWTWENNSWAQMGGATVAPETVTVDSTVKEDSTNAVSGGAVYHELAYKLDASELTNSISTGGTNAVTSGAICDALDLKLDASKLTTSITAGSTDVVTSGAIYDALALKLDSANVDSTVIQYSSNPVSGGAVYDELASKLDASDVESIENSDIDSLFA